MSLAHLQSGFEPPPNTSDEWLQDWAKSKTIDVLGKSGNSVTLDIVNIQPAEEADLLVETADGKRFYVEFQKSPVFSARELPTFVVPDCKPDKGWWLLPNV